MQVIPLIPVLLSVFVAAPVVGQVTTGTDSNADGRLVGLWGAERVVGPAVRGTLTLTKRQGLWSGTIAGRTASVIARRDALRLVLPGGAGELRGHLSADSSRIIGHWIEPFTGQRRASPLELKRVGPGRWRGEVVPLDEAVALYFAIRSQPDESLSAGLRNPDGNVGDGLYAVTLDGGRIHFADGNGNRLDGTYDASRGRFSLDIPPYAGVFEFTPRDRADAPGFYPRASTVPYVYRPPSKGSDGWGTATLAEVGLDKRPIEALVQRILDVDPAAKGVPLIQGLVIARHGKLVLDEYFYGFDAARLHDLRSASKTFASVMLGVALEHGAAFDVATTPVLSLFPEYSALANPDPRKRQITVEHLMTMTTGLACDENDGSSPGNEGTMQSQAAQPDWYKFTLDLPQAHTPGDTALYCSGTVNLIGGVVRNTTHAWLPDLFRRYVAEPLGIQRYSINLMPGGDAYTGGGMYLRPRDAIKLGQLYLDGGVWNGRRVLSADWVRRSTMNHVRAGAGDPDGYDWHLHNLKAGERTYREYEASGNGGQFVMVLPELDLVVTFTAGNYGSYGVWRRFREELVPQYVIPAVEDR